MGFPALVAVGKFIKRHWPLLVALGILGLTTAVLWGQVLDKNRGQFVYTLDDPYIHMAIAKNVVQHGIWGITPYQFSSSTSAPLWTVFLALVYALFGVQALTPFVLDLLLAGTAIGLVYGLLRDWLPGWAIFLTLLAVLFCTPLAPLVFSGMEHVAQIVLTILIAGLAVRVLSADQPGRVIQAGLLVSVSLLVGVRYEGLFITLVLAILFVCRKRWQFGLLLIGAGALPVIAYGLWSLAHGWYFLPNPVLLKGVGGNNNLISFLKSVLLDGHPITRQAIEQILPPLFLRQIFANRHILVLVVASLILLAFQRGRFWQPGSLTNITFLGVVVLHMQFARTGWFFRYEAYLVAFGIYAIALGIGELPFWQDGRLGAGFRAGMALGLLLLIVLFSYPLRQRAIQSLELTPLASHNIYEQQIQMSDFLRQYYPGQVVAANDIGAIDFRANIRLVDLAGLGTMESAEFTLNENYGAYQVAEVATRYQTQIALVYDSWFHIPPTWIKVGEWQIPNNVVCGDSTVSFYAVNPAAAQELIANLRSFDGRLPQDVARRGY